MKQSGQESHSCPSALNTPSSSLYFISGDLIARGLHQGPFEESISGLTRVNVPERSAVSHGGGGCFVTCPKWAKTETLLLGFCFEVIFLGGGFMTCLFLLFKFLDHLQVLFSILKTVNALSIQRPNNVV